MKNLYLILLSLILLVSCSTSKKELKKPYTKADFEKLIDGKKTSLYTLENKNGMVVTMTNYGAKIVSIYVPDKKGKLGDVVLGFKSIDEYMKYGASHGATVGPFANRISNSLFMIDGISYQLPVNNGKACLHSGPDSFYRKVWEATQTGNSVAMTLESPDGEFGFPGNKKVKVTFSLTDDNELKIEYEATTDKPCYFNLTNHSYFNLKGEGDGDILNHILVINASQSTPVDSSMIPTGEVVDIQGSALDFTSPHAIGERIDANNQQLIYGAGYDFNYIINKPEGELAFAASAYEPSSGRYMEVFTTEPGIQLYTGNYLDGTEIGKKGKPYTKRTGFCLETQHFPDSPNKPEFPSTLLKPGETLHSTTIYKFSVKD
ncbi:MAG: galactose mutarotase [Chlorobi bacterium]|nr:galactose mutarotase [Chlorobiota bacterium]